MELVNITIGSLTFDHADYDAANDVLYLYAGKPTPGEGEETPEGAGLDPNVLDRGGGVLGEPERVIAAGVAVDAVYHSATVMG
jgi:hypothetical protein